jgi:hypothetical protein
VFGDPVNGDPASDRWLEKGDFVRLQNIVVGVRIPSACCRLRARPRQQPAPVPEPAERGDVHQLLGLRPRVLGLGDPLARGVDDGLIYPNPRTLTFGLDVRF